MTKRPKAPAVKLTPHQRRRVKAMLEDGEAYTRAEAVAWVTFCLDCGRCENCRPDPQPAPAP